MTRYILTIFVMVAIQLMTITAASAGSIGSVIKGVSSLTDENTDEKLTWSGGSIYEGEIRNGKMHGKGVYTWLDGERHEGEFVNGNFHGQSVETSPDGSRYEGEYRDGKLHGQGVYTWPSGSLYEGEWRDGEKWKGIEMAPNGRAFIYRDGKQI